MKLCPTCGQPVADEITVCPACGQDVSGRRQAVDDYRIVDVLHEGYSTFLCRAIRERTDEHVMIRLFTPRSGVNADVAARLQRELEELKKLPDDGFVRHFAIRRSADGLWYRISEWVETESWGSLLASGRLGDRRIAARPLSPDGRDPDGPARPRPLHPPPHPERHHGRPAGGRHARR